MNEDYKNFCTTLSIQDYANSYAQTWDPLFSPEVFQSGSVGVPKQESELKIEMDPNLMQSSGT